ncbi:hypothetical protein EBR96_04825, partial [bacterium]|nr:hypothetical protein [bacterium]
GIERAKNNLVLLLNNDAYFLTADTLKTSIRLLSSTVKIVGHKILNLDGTVNHFGIFADGLIGKTGHLGRYFSAEDSRLRTPIETLAVTGACLLLERMDIRFDPRYWFENEDVDFCFEYMKRGYAIVCNSDCEVVHEESSTRATAAKIETEWTRKQQAGHDYFFKKWRWFMIRRSGWLWRQWELLHIHDQNFFRSSYSDWVAGIVTFCALMLYPGPMILLYLGWGAVCFFAAKAVVVAELRKIIKTDG